MRELPAKLTNRLFFVNRLITDYCGVVSVVRSRKIVYLFICLILPLKLHQTQARSSAGEHFPDAEGVGGSIPPVPTKILHSCLIFIIEYVCSADAFR